MKTSLSASLPTQTMLTTKIIARMIDHSLLRPEMTEAMIISGCELAKAYDTASVCVRPCDVALASRLLKGSQVLVGTVIGFPHGTHHTATKVFEAQQALDDGAAELDMVMNYSRLLSGDTAAVAADIKAVTDLAHQRQAIVKVIFENCYLSHEQIIKACEISESAGADYVKTSTGFGTGGAKLDDIKLMRQTCGSQVKIKAAGGIRSLDSLLAFRQAGTDRIGATATAVILDEAKKRESEKTLL